ncbi:MAG: hypothetical protein QXL15_00060 [Candidatus Korarchaeota archaeon]
MSLLITGIKKRVGDVMLWNMSLAEDLLALREIAKQISHTYNALNLLTTVTCCGPTRISRTLTKNSIS